MAAPILSDLFTNDMKLRAGAFASRPCNKTYSHANFVCLHPETQAGSDVLLLAKNNAGSTPLQLEAIYK